MRHCYFAPRIRAQRLRITPPPLPATDPAAGPILAMPTFTLVDPDGEPLQVEAVIPDYGQEVEPIRELHVFALPAGDQTYPTAEELLASEGVPHAFTDVTHIRGPVVLELRDLPDGDYDLQPVVVAGRD